MKISISKVRLFKCCRRAYELKYVEGLIPVETPEALETGRSYHEKIEELYKKGSFDDSDYSKASAMAKAYEKNIYCKFPMRNVEEWFEYKLNSKHTLVGRVDGIAYAYPNEVLVEHKTTSQDIESYEFDLVGDEQILCYMMAYGVRDMIYTIVKKPTIRQKKSEIDEEFYNRMLEWYETDTETKVKMIPIERSEKELSEYKDQLIKLCDEMERAEETNTLYRNPAYCYHWNKLCEYAQICNTYDKNETYINFERKKEVKKYEN